MTSVLASQLQALALQRQPALPQALKKGKPSLLFDYQKAGDVDLQTIYGIASGGLEDLIRLEPRFRVYRESLFSRASLEINPELQTSDFLAKVDDSILGFCSLLTNHFLAPSAFKTLEYLIRRYKANVRNVDALLTAALPYHATNEFVRLVQVLALGAPGSLWGWLAKMQSSGASLPRHLLAQRCANDRQLLMFICKAAGHLGGAAPAGSVTMRPHSRTFLSFYAVLVCEVLAVLPSVGEEILAALLPHLLEGLGQGAAQDYRAATLMIVAELCSRATLGRDFIKVLLNTMLKHTEPVPEHIRTAVLVMAHIAVTQPHIRSLSDKTLKYFSALPNVIPELSSLAQRGNIRLGPLLLLLSRSLAAALAAGGPAGRRCEGDLLALAHTGVLRGDSARTLASALLEAGCGDKVDEAVRASCQKILRILDQRYPETTDAAVNSFLEPLREQRRKAIAAATNTADDKTKRKRRKTDGAGSGSDDDEGIDAAGLESAEQAAAGLSPEDRARFEYVSSTFSAGGYSAPCGGTMLTLAAALVAPQAAVRRMALQQLDADLVAAGLGGSEASAEATTEARAALTAAALTRLRDDDLGVVVAALGLSCLRQLPPTALLDALQPLCCQVSEYLYGSAKLPQLKAARKAARKIISLLRHVGTESEELRQAVAVQLAGMLLPNHRDPRVAVEAAKAISALGLPLFSGLADAVPQLEAQLKGAAADAAGKGKDTKGKKAATAAAVTAIERGILSAVAKTIADSPSAGAEEVARLVAATTASASTGENAAASAASRRVRHLALLATHAAIATAVAAAHAAAGSPKPDKSIVLLRFVVQLSESLLPYTRSTSATSADGEGWLSTFDELVSPRDGLPTAAHSAAVQADAEGAHAASVLGALHSSLTRLPEASAVGALHDSLARLPLATDAQAGPSSAIRLLGLLASLECPVQRLRDLPVLVTTRAVQPSNRSTFLAGIYAAPSTASTAPALQCMALQVQAQLASSAATTRGHASPPRHSSPPRFPSIDVGGWLVTLLAALSSPDVSVRSAACDCLAAVEALLESGKAAAGSHLSARAAALLCCGLQAHRKLLCRDAEAAVVLLRGALHHDGAAAAGVASPGAATITSPGRSGGKKKDAAARLELSASTAAEVSAYLTSCLQSLGADDVGVNTASAALACLVSSDAAVGPELLAAGSSYLSRCIARLRDQPSSATALHAGVVQQLVRLFTPASVAAAVSAGHEDQIAPLAQATELLPLASAMPQSSVAALAAIRLAAVSQLTKELFAALPGTGAAVSTLFAVLLVRSEGDSDEAVRAAARASLEVIPLSAELIAPLVNPPTATVAPAAAAPATETPAVRSKKKSKKGDVGSEAAVAAPAAAPSDAAPAPPAALNLAALRDAVAALELLQWRTGISKPHLLVPACQSLLRRLQPIIGSIVSSLRAEGEADDVDAVAIVTDVDAGAKSSLAGYAATLTLQALTALARLDGAAADAAQAQQLSSTFDLELAVATAREAPDAAVRNAALGLLAALAARMPEAALSHVLQVLAVVHQSAALQDDEHSRAVGATALAAVVPAWVAAGQRSAALWEQVAAALPALPAHRRLDLLVALLRALPKVEEGLSEGLLVLLQHATEPKRQAPAVASPAAEPGSAGKAPKSAKKARAETDASPMSDAAAAGPLPSEFLPDLASQLALQVELSTRLACCARVLELALSASSQQPHTALPRLVVAFVTGQLKLKAALSAASASHRRPEPNPALEAACRRLMEAALAHMQLLQPDAVAADQGNGASTPSSRQGRAVLAASRGLYGLFAALQGVMAADVYLQALLTLAEHPADKVKRRAIKLFTDKVRGVRAEIQDQIELPQRVRDAKLRQASEAATRACTMLPPLLSTAGGSSAASPLTRQLALVALSAIASEFGAEQHATLLASVPSVLAATKDSHASIRASSLATVAAFVKALGSRLVPVLPSSVAAAVAAADSAWARLSRAGSAPAAAAAMEVEAAELSDDDDDDEGDGGRRRRRGTSDEEDAALELSSALACLNALVETLGGFLSPHLPSVLAILLNPRVLACRVAGCDQFAASIRARLPTTVPARLLLPALYDRLQPCIDAAADATGAEAASAPMTALLLMVASAASALEAKLAAQYCDQMFAFLLRALDVRQRRPAALAAHGDAAIDAVEAAGIRAIVALVMKLSEARFKPLFLRMLEWASTVSVPEGFGAGTEPSYLGRMVALFGVVNALADRLRSVLVPYYRYLLDSIVQHLTGDDGGASKRGKKKQKRASVAVGVEAAAAVELGGSSEAYQATQMRLTWLLRLRIVRALHRCFLHDTVGFVDAERFGRFQPALIQQLDSEPPEGVVPFLLSPHHADPDLSSYVKLGPSTRMYTAADGTASSGPLGAAAVGALLAMAVAANSDAMWKPLNHATLMLTRSSTARTRALALEVVAQLVDRLREEYLVLLPESLPFMSELLEDVDAAVAARVREVIAQLEEISGEKLDEYLKV